MVQNLLPGAPSVVAQGPQAKVGGDAFDRAPMNVPGVSSTVPQRSMAAGFVQLGAGLEDFAVPLAKQQAAADVARAPADPSGIAVAKGADGLPEILRPASSFILGRAGEAYQSAVESGEKAKSASAISEFMTRTRVAKETDPEGFLAAGKSYAETLRANNPGEVGNALYAHAMNEATQHFTSLTEAKARRDTASSLQSITTGIEDTKNQLSAMARQGAIDTPEYESLKGKLVAGYASLGQDPRFGFGPDKIKSETTRAVDDLRAQYIVGEVDRTYHRASGDSGKAGAQKMLEEKILNNPDLHLSDAERKQAYAWGMSRLSYLTDSQRADIAASKATTKSTLALYAKNPAGVPDALYDAAIDKARNVGDADSVADLQTARMAATMTRPTAGMSTEQRFNTVMGGGAPSGSEKSAVDFFLSKGWSPVQASGIVGNLIRESRLNAGAINRGDGSDGSDSIGIGQWNGSRAAALKQFAAAQGKPWHDIGVQLAFVQHELEGSESNAARMLKGANDARSAAAAFALGYERPKGFMTGDINQVSGGADRVAHATRLAGGGASPAAVPQSANGVPFTADQLRQNPILMSGYAHALAANADNQITLGKSVGEALMTSVKAGIVPSETTYANYLQIAAQHPETFGEQSQKIQATIYANAGVTKAYSPADAEAFVQRVDERARTEPSILNAQAAEAAHAALTRQAEALKTDPFGESARREWISRAPAPLDFSSREALTRSMTEHAQAAVRISDHTGHPVSAISPAQLPQIKALLTTTGNIDQRAILLQSISEAGMTEPVMRATLEQLGKDAPTKPLAVAGDVARFNPQVAHDILQGQALMQENKDLAPNKDDFPTEFAKLLPINDLPDSEARKNYDAAIKALYAKRSAEANDLTGILNQDRLETVVKDVLGGIVGWRGGKAIAPWYGASQSDYDAAIRTVTDADLANSRGSDGVPLPASALKPSLSGAFGFGGNWSLQSIDGGKYLIFPNTGQMPRQYLRVDPRSPGYDPARPNFVLDLGAKRAAVEAQGLRLATPSFTSTETSFPLDQAPN